MIQSKRDRYFVVGFPMNGDSTEPSPIKNPYIHLHRGRARGENGMPGEIESYEHIALRFVT